MNTPCAAGRTTPGELLRLVMDGTAGGGFDARPPGTGESCRMTIACAGARCTLSVSDWGNAEWEYRPCSPAEADPDLAADLAATLLTGRPGPYPRLGHGHGHGTRPGAPPSAHPPEDPCPQEPHP